MCECPVPRAAEDIVSTSDDEQPRGSVSTGPLVRAFLGVSAVIQVRADNGVSTRPVVQPTTMLVSYRECKPYTPLVPSSVCGAKPL
jgi:hypothetical protein